MAVKNSTSVLVFVDSTAVASSLDATISFNGEAVNISTKDTGRWEAFFAGALNGTVSVSGLYEDGNLDALWTAFTDSAASTAGSGSEVTLKFGNAVSGEEYWEGTAIITALEVGSPGYQQAMTYNASFQLTGTITKADNL